MRGREQEVWWAVEHDTRARKPQDHSKSIGGTEAATDSALCPAEPCSSVSIVVKSGCGSLDNWSDFLKNTNVII